MSLATFCVDTNTARRHLRRPVVITERAISRRQSRIGVSERRIDRNRLLVERDGQLDGGHTALGPPVPRLAILIPGFRTGSLVCRFISERICEPNSQRDQKYERRNGRPPSPERAYGVLSFR